MEYPDITLVHNELCMSTELVTDTVIGFKPDDLPMSHQRTCPLDFNFRGFYVEQKHFKEDVWDCRLNMKLLALSF